MVASLWHLPNRHRLKQRLCWLLVLHSVLAQWCAPCEDLPSTDGAPWETVDGYSCVSGYGFDPAYDCANYGSDADQYGLTGKQACCVCGGGSTAQFLWVANGGHDTSACGAASDDPCQTIAYGLGQFPQALEMTSNATLHVAAGTYSVPQEGINFEGRPVMIVGEKSAVVDCNGSHNGFVAMSGEPSTAVSPLRRALATAKQPTSQPAHSVRSHSLRCDPVAVVPRLHPQIFRSSALTRQICLQPIIPLCTNSLLVTATKLSVGCVGAGGAGGAQLRQHGSAVARQRENSRRAENSRCQHHRHQLHDRGLQQHCGRSEDCFGLSCIPQCGFLREHCKCRWRGCCSFRRQLAVRGMPLRQ